MCERGEFAKTYLGFPQRSYKTAQQADDYTAIKLTNDFFDNFLFCWQSISGNRFRQR